jgi:hypothetical protein
MTDKEMVVHRLAETSNFIDYLKTSPLFSKSLIDVMVTAIDNGVALLTDQPDIVLCKDCKYSVDTGETNILGKPLLVCRVGGVYSEQRLKYPDGYCDEGKRKD